MKYTLIVFTFNVIKDPNVIGGSKLQLRNNWHEQSKDDDTLKQELLSLGFKEPLYFPNTNKVVKMSGDFTLDDPRIIVHIIKN